MSKKNLQTNYAINKKANYNFNIKDKFEAGIVLLGSEVKSIRSGQCNLSDSFIVARDNQIFLENFFISKYKNARDDKYNPTKSRKLLLNKKELNKIAGNLQRTGTSATALKIYNNSRNYLKVEIALVTGKKLHDKRETIKAREWERNKARILKNHQ
jgi:SsrA-binding protein